MLKTVAALMALIVGGFAGAVATSDSDAQRVVEVETEIVTLEKDGDVILKVNGELVEVTTETSTFLTPTDKPPNLTFFAQQGKWEIREVHDWVMLFNPATGETYYLDDDDDRLTWKRIQRQQSQPKRTDARPERNKSWEWRRYGEREDNRRGERKETNRRWEREMEDAEDRADRGGEAIDRLREALERAEEARKFGRKMREGREKDEREDNRRGNRERNNKDNRNDNFNNKLEKIVDEIANLKDKLDDVDGEQLKKIERKLKQKYEEIRKLRDRSKDTR
ncbi:MAG: hypothetical protein L3J82_07340 [Planctomycetes bacterium]|nr:hypothetical protein [Planctomycetota bacterium]